MSLRVWLPLNGDLHNQGLDDITVTNSGATVATGGKIGKCCNFDGTGYMYTNTSPDLNIKSACFWLYATNTSNFVAFCDYKSGLAFGVYSSYIPVSCNRASGQTLSSTCYPKTLLTLNTWNHIAVIRNETTPSLVDLYINGEKQTPNTQSNRYQSGVTDKLSFGARPNGNEKLNGKLNDFRLYDHALSAKEVKEISKALVLHYPLNDPYIETTVPLTNSIDNTCFNGATSKYNYGTSTDMYKEDGFFQNRQCTKVHMGTAGLDAYPYVHFSNFTATMGNTRTLSFDYYPTSQEFVQFYTHSTDGSSIWENTSNGIKGTSTARSYSIPVILNTWNHIIVTVTNTGTTNQGWGYMQIGKAKHISTTTDYWLFSNVMIEEKDHATGYTTTSRTETFVYDTSGYNHDGIANNIIISTDTPRYDISSVFTSTNSSYIKINDNTWMSQGATEYTINLWAYIDNWENQSSAHFFSCTESGGFNTENNNGNISHPVHVYTNSEQTSTSYVHGAFLRVSELSSGWHMLTFIYTTSGKKIYVDGELHDEYAYTSYGVHFNENARLFLGCEASTANPTTPYLTGKESDFRLYYTALSADDIKELYNVGMSIDNEQNIYSGSLTEEQYITSIYKKRIIKSSIYTEDLLASINKEINPNLLIDTNKGITNWRYSHVGDSGWEVSCEPIICNSINSAKFSVISKGTGWIMIYHILSNELLNSFKPNTKYTISLNYKTNNDSKSLNCYIVKTNALDPLTDQSSKVLTGDEKWHKYTATLTTKETLPTINGQVLYFYGTATQQEDGNYIIINNLKIEEDDHATPYIPYEHSNELMHGCITANQFYEN